MMRPLNILRHRKLELVALIAKYVYVHAVVSVLEWQRTDQIVHTLLPEILNNF